MIYLLKFKHIKFLFNPRRSNCILNTVDMCNMASIFAVVQPTFLRHLLVTNIASRNNIITKRKRVMKSKCSLQCIRSLHDVVQRGTSDMKIKIAEITTVEKTSPNVFTTSVTCLTAVLVVGRVTKCQRVCWVCIVLYLLWKIEARCMHIELTAFTTITRANKLKPADFAVSFGVLLEVVLVQVVRMAKVFYLPVVVLRQAFVIRT